MHLGIGIYSVTDAARLSGVSVQRIRRWLQGYSYRVDECVHKSPPVWKPQLPIVDGKQAVSFLDLVEIRFVDSFRKHGVSWKTIRAAARYAFEKLHSNHPFSTRQFRTDGRSIFEEAINKTGERQLLDVVKSQLAFRQILSPYLYDGLEFGPSDAVIRWCPVPGLKVIIDPKRSFGQPVLVGCGIPTITVANAFKAEGSLRRVAHWFDITTREVQDAVRFEKKFAA